MIQVRDVFDHVARVTRLGVLLVVAAACGAGACSKARAQTVPDGPPLAMPLPPARVITPIEEPLAAVPITTELPAAAGAPTPPPRTPPRRTDTAAAAPAQPPPPVTPAPAPVVEPPRPTRPTAHELAEEKRIRGLLSRASRDIGRLDYRRLSNEGRAQYDQSKALAEQAEQAIKDRNWVFADTLADKAATLAAELLDR
jgi:hypothetical protein